MIYDEVGGDESREPVRIVVPSQPDASVQLSEHFRLAEFSVSGSHPTLVRPIPPQYLPNVRRLVTTILEPLRVALGVPVYVNSGYRPPPLNTAVGGSPTSQHMTAGAADITTSGTRAAFERLVSHAIVLPHGQCIMYPDNNFIHIAIPSAGHPTPTYQVHCPRMGYRYRTVYTLDVFEAIMRAVAR